MKKIIIITLIFAAVLALDFMAVVRARKIINVQERHIAEQQKALDRVPTFTELQEMVGAEPDGIIGPNTIEKWERKICGQYAVEAIDRMAGVK